MPRKSTKVQAKSSFCQRAKIALIQRGLSVTELSAQIGRPRSSVSKAINQNRFPLIREQIEGALHL